MKPIIICLCLSSLALLPARGQRPADIAGLRMAAPLSPPAAPYYREMAGHSHNEAEWLLSTLFLGYKAFISSQDGSACNFHPSCSEYALLSIQKLGLVRGSLAAFDRLTRCNGLSPELYEGRTRDRRWIDHP